MQTEEGYQPVFFDPRPLKNLLLIDEMESLSPVMDLKARAPLPDRRSNGNHVRIGGMCLCSRDGCWILKDLSPQKVPAASMACPCACPDKSASFLLFHTWMWQRHPSTLVSSRMMVSAQVANLLNEETPQIYAACGRGSRSTLRVLRPGLAVTELAVWPLPGAPTAVWTLKRSQQDELDAYIVVSFDNATLVTAAIWAHGSFAEHLYACACLPAEFMSDHLRACQSMLHANATCPWEAFPMRKLCKLFPAARTGMLLTSEMGLGRCCRSVRRWRR